MVAEHCWDPVGQAIVDDAEGVKRIVQTVFLWRRKRDGEEPREIDKEVIDKLLTNYQKPEDMVGENGLLKQLTKALVERARETELTTHQRT